MKMRKLGILLFAIVFAVVSSTAVNAANIAEYQQETEEISKGNQEEVDETLKDDQEEKDGSENDQEENKGTESDQEESKNTEKNQEDNKDSESSSVQTQEDNEGIDLQADEADQTSQFEVQNWLINYPDRSKQFTYDLTLKSGSSNFSGELVYNICSISSTPFGDSIGPVEETGKLEVINGKATLSVGVNRTFIIKKMPANLSYTVKLREETGYTIADKSGDEGITSASPTSAVFKSSYYYEAVDYSFETDIVAAITGREFKSGDSFSYSVIPGSEGAPVVMGYETDDSGAFPVVRKIEMDTFTLNPTSGYIYPYSLKAELKRESGSRCLGCGRYFYTSSERMEHGTMYNCNWSYTVLYHMFNVSPQVRFIYPGTYSYLVKQEKYSVADGGVIPDTSIYKMNITVTAGSNNALSATLSSVQRSTDNGSTWSNVPNKEQLTFTNSWSSTSPRITLDRETLNLEKNNTGKLAATLINMPADSAITWTSSNEAVATVKDGIVTAVGGGKATITATAGGASAFCEVNVRVPMTGISIKNGNVEVSRGNTVRLEVTYEPSDTTDSKAVTWTSSNESVAAVDPDTGVVTGVKNGKAEITVKTMGTGTPFTATTKVTVTEKHITDSQGEQIEFEKLEQLLKGQSVSMGDFLNLSKILEDNQITDSYSITWSSTDEEVAAIDQTGKTTGIKEGKTTIKAVITFKSGDGNITGEYPVETEIEVKEIPLNSIAFDRIIKEMVVGTTETVHIIYNPNNTTDLRDVIWESSDSSIISVENGKITALRVGEAEITATVGDKKVSCKITVKEAASTQGTNQNNTGTKENKTNNATEKIKTGDTANIVVYLVMLLVSLIAIFLLYVRRSYKIRR